MIGISIRKFKLKKFFLLLGLSWICSIGIKQSDESFRFEPYLISNFYANELFQTIKPPSPSINLVLVSGPSYNDQDSLLGELVSKISKHKPKVIAVDYDITEKRLFKNFKIRDSVTIVLASVFNEKDSIKNPVNIFDGIVHYGHVNGSNSFLLKESQGIPTLPEKVLEIYSQSLFAQYKQRGVEYDYINYPSPNETHLYSSMSGNFVDDLFNDRIVLVGKFGSANIFPKPSWSDNTDIHETPIGKQFGAFVLFSQINTMLGNYIEPASTGIELTIGLIVCSLSIVLILMAQNLPSKMLYIGTKIYTLIMIFALLLVCTLIYGKFNTIIDFRFLCWSVILSTELSFWFSLGPSNDN